MGEFEVGDAVLCHNGTATVQEIELRRRSTPVYNIEVHGEHVYEVTSNGILVHNADPATSAIGDALEKQIAGLSVSRSKYPQTAQHIEEAQAAGHPSELTIDRSGAAANRGESPNGIDKVPGKQLDEYPPAMFQEGVKVPA